MGIIGKFASYDFLYKTATQTARRFPFTLLSALVGTVIAVILIAYKHGDDQYGLQRVLLICGLGLPLFTALVAFAERRKWGRGAALALQGAGLLLLLVYFFTLPHEPFQHTGDAVRFLLLAIAAHFLVAFLPYLSGDQVQGFWQFNKSLFLRFLTSALFSAVMFAGLAIALAALDFLFGVDVDEDLYFQLWVIIAVFFNTWVFLAGIPDDLNRLDEITDYPRGLKIFAQYILLPLVGLYLIILYVYEAKIIIQWSWPRGWVSELILWFSVVGILSLLLLWPLRQLSENKWVRTFATWFFRLLIPLVVMLFFAVLERVSDYGITVNRYLVIAMAVGLALVVLYFVLGRAKDIRAIPIIVFAIALLSALGPWGALSVAQSSQTNRLDAYLTKYGLGTGPIADSTDQKISAEDREEMSSIVMYLNNWHSVDAFSRWLPDSALAPLDTMPRYSGVNDSISRLLGFQFQYPHFVSEGGTYFSITARENDVVSITDYNYMTFLRPRWVSTPDDSLGVPLGDDSVRIGLDLQTDRTLTLAFRYASPDSTERVVISLADSLARFKGHGGDTRLPSDSLTFALISRSYDIALVLRQVSGAAYPDSVRVDHVDGLLLFRRR